MIKADTVLYASDNSDASIKEAREYLAEKGLTPDDARLIRKGDAVMVIAKREIWNE